jgi:hypothetical protein
MVRHICTSFNHNISQKVSKDCHNSSSHSWQYKKLNKKVLVHRDSFNISIHITRMVWVIAFSSPDSLVISPISLSDWNHFHLSKFRTETNPAAETRSIGLLANAQLSWFLHHHLDSFILTWQISPFTWTQSSGQLYRDTKILPTYRDFAKTHANPDTDGNSPYHRAVSWNKKIG